MSLQIRSVPGVSTYFFILFYFMSAKGGLRIYEMTQYVIAITRKSGNSWWYEEESSCGTLSADLHMCSVANMLATV